MRDMKRSATSDLTIGGANLAAHAFKGGLDDECHLFICPVLVGDGKPALPRDLRAKLELVDERRFAGGVVYLRYRNPTCAIHTHLDLCSPF
ncbi:MAG: dihydrofolate reductase family protein [Acidimicrobiales bacterium]